MIETKLECAVASIREHPLQVSRLTDGESLPGLVTPRDESEDLLTMARRGKTEIRRALRDHGALLFRGFDPRTPAHFGEICAALSDRLLDYTERSTPRSQVEGKVYTSTEYPPTEYIPLHCEMAYTTRWPRILWFYSHLVAGEGGETTICDARKVYQSISPVTRQRFARGVMYVRNFHKGIDLPWQAVYGVATKAELESYCAAHRIAVEWRAGGELRTRAVAQAVAHHPETGEPAWFNQAHLFHASNLQPSVRRLLAAKFGEEGMPRDAYYGDGAPIEAAAIEEIRRAYAKAEVVFQWTRGDVLMVDNMLVSHGRRPFKGARKTLVAMAEEYPPT